MNARTSTTNFQIRLVAITLLQLLLAGVLPVCAEESGSLTTSDGPEQQTILTAATADSASVSAAEITTDAEPTLSNIEQQIRAYDLSLIHIFRPGLFQPFILWLMSLILKPRKQA